MEILSDPYLLERSLNNSEDQTTNNYRKSVKILTVCGLWKLVQLVYLYREFIICRENKIKLGSLQEFYCKPRSMNTEVICSTCYQPWHHSKKVYFWA